MTPKQMNDYLIQRVEHWRKKLRIDPDLELTVKFVTSHSSDPCVTNYGEVFLSDIQYGRATIHIYDNVFKDDNFKVVADQTIFHELMHIALSDIMAYCENMFGDDDGKRAELTRLEETFITRMERSFAGRHSD